MSSHAHDPALPPPLMAGGQPISEAIADQAAEWLTVLMSGEATEAQHLQWQTWRRSHPDHERAWRHIETVRARLKVLEPRATRRALASPDRRKLLSLLLWSGAAGNAAWLAPRTRTWQQLTATHHTASGEQRTVALEDGTEITLNTRSAIDARFDATQRLLRLVAGEIMIVTAHAATGSRDARPFIVETAEGRIRALGTRFSVRQHEGRTHVAVVESAVEITPRDSPRLTRVLHAGGQTTFTRSDIAETSPVADQATAWTRGQLIVDDSPLGDFLSDLARYRTGVLRCDPAVAGLRLSGVFPLHDTDRILTTLPRLLPVQVRGLTRYWITVEAAS